ncbi:PH domain-containing protein [Porphyrobacter sp. SLTP]|uniref:PH domain-containing protein n=1 Tax=Porphyrobacter sp. SLTP TaxID=2683266 RepID=UPI0014121110|nr:PH domain-containing protein [Porphyrobacter sp. SLTP]NBB23855.1 PH domain-containing protein [Porphyrobacter sp. SLTP]
MGLINATVWDAEDAAEDLAYALAHGEVVRFAFKLVRDSIIFTDRRILMIDIQGLTGSKKRFLTIPYRAITTFTLESAGHFDLDTELTLTVSGSAPIAFNVSRGADVPGLVTLLTEYLAPGK